jgi:hypothetical protein
MIYLNGTQHAVSVESPATRQVQSHFQKLHFLQLAEWDERKSYGEDVPTCLHYSIEWKVLVNIMVISKDTEQDLVLAPTAYDPQVKLGKLLRKVTQNRHIRCDDRTNDASL